MKHPGDFLLMHVGCEGAESECLPYSEGKKEYPQGFVAVLVGPVAFQEKCCGRKKTCKYLLLQSKRQ